ncbi:DUF5802 family protein [Halococcoides cellulosivorans]|uniref:Uncharacterized protein n=1 Tax=Halococcoides cellulosivorans TaxID=1679096 RepID=A0A2R4X0V7_9EURY|nr:DUF5802 family protein [Halococcoides cellulosivorans]AWB27434.1 hypothetical protein HARCEL1_06810 [Halococcoides cellulosivorans]
MFERFSRGYYLGRMYVEPHDGDRATMAASLHERVNDELYTPDEGVQRLDLPVVMKLGSTHFTVVGAEDVPSDTLAVPKSVVEAADLKNPPSRREVLLAKADRAVQILQTSLGLPGTDDVSPHVGT